jgi:hypothetical protein
MSKPTQIPPAQALPLESLITPTAQGIARSRSVPAESAGGQYSDGLGRLVDEWPPTRTTRRIPWPSGSR